MLVGSKKMLKSLNMVALYISVSNVKLAMVEKLKYLSLTTNKSYKFKSDLRFSCPLDDFNIKPADMMTQYVR